MDRFPNKLNCTQQITRKINICKKTPNNEHDLMFYTNKIFKNIVQFMSFQQKQNLFEKMISRKKEMKF